jgi:hypothetical protein
VSRILGHASIATTANVYGHLTDAMRQGLLARVSWHRSAGLVGRCPEGREGLPPEQPAPHGQPNPVAPAPGVPEQDPWKPHGWLRDSCLFVTIVIVGFVVLMGIFWLAIIDSLARN